METEMERLKDKADAGTALTRQEQILTTCIKEALAIFPDEDAFVYHRADKGGRYRMAPIVAPDAIKEQIIQRFQETPPGEKVWLHVNGRADIHGYRGTYCARIYRKYARSYEKIPYDRINAGSGIKYKSQVYYCKADEKGRKLDRVAMEMCTKALGHSRLSVISNNYLYDI